MTPQRHPRTQGPAASAAGAQGRAPAGPGKRNALSRGMLVLRLVFSVSLLTWVLARADWSLIASDLGHAHWGYMFLFLAITPINAVLSVWKWQLLLTAKALHVSFARLFNIYVVSQFYNNVLPSSVGGDVVRTVMLHREVKDMTPALASIVVERFTGLSVMVLLALAAFASPGIRANAVLVTLVALLSVGYVMLLLAVFSPRAVALLQRATSRIRGAPRVVDKVGRFQASLRGYLDQPWVLANALVLSLAFYVGAILSIWWVAAALGHPMSFTAAAIVTPTVLLIALIPLTINGIGLTEWAFVATFEAMGLPGSVGLSAALLLRAKQIVWSSGCYGVVLLATGRETLDRNAAGVKPARKPAHESPAKQADY